MTLDFSLLPEVSFAETDTASIEESVLTAYEAVAGTTLYPGDPVRLFLEGLALIVAQQRQVIEHAARQNLVAFAEGAFLDQLGALHGATRLPASAATATVRFALDQVRTFSVPIPAGTRVTPDGALYFSLDQGTEIPAGARFVDAQTTCAETGSVGNGLVPGQIARLVDPVAYVVSAVNTTTSAGGADQETDERFRLRIAEAPESYSVAGPLGAYLYWARSASALIEDVAVVSPAPGEVVVYPLLLGGEIPGSEILDAVLAVLTDERVRPLTDSVSVLAPAPVPFDLEVVWFLDADNAGQAATIQAAVSAAVDDWLEWQRAKLGRDINPSRLVAEMVRAGAKRVAVASPAFATVAASEVAALDGSSVTYGGTEEA